MNTLANDVRYNLYKQFLELFPLESLRKMPLERYTNLKRSDSFCYWIESKTASLGSIWGGSSYKFGIYRHNKAPIDNRVISDDEYTWYVFYGAQTRQEAYEKVINAVAEIAEAAAAKDFDKVENNNMFDTTRLELNTILKAPSGIWGPLIFVVLYGTMFQEFLYLW